jgi:Glycosyl transferases group 1
MEKTAKPKLIFFQFRHDKNLSEIVLLHRQDHVKCLLEFFDVTVINEDCDYQQICDKYEPDITLFESGVNYRTIHRLNIKNTNTYPAIPKLGLHNGDSWCEARTGFLSDMDYWGIETFFSICTTTAEHTPEIADHLFVWPNFVNSDIYRDYKQAKDIPVFFTGMQYALYPWREKINKIISQGYPSVTCPHPGYEKSNSAAQIIYGERYARIINSSWFVPTCGTLEKEIVRKHLEIPACNSCLITEKSPALEAAGFIDMQNCVFADKNDVLDKLNYLFQNPELLEKITNAGYQLVQSRHTLKQRDQIFQWFNLYKSLKQNQIIIQTNPFQPLIVVEKSSGIKNSHIICNGLVIDLLRKGDEKLWTGKYEDAESLYLKCFNYINWMPEPKLKLALCNLYQGNAKKAFSWITQPIKYTLDEYKALDPDPVEWAYFIICLLCQGKLIEAIIRIDQFSSLSHPELDRTRWVISCLQNQQEKLPEPEIKLSNPRYSIHKLPSLSLTDWINNLCTMLQACQQSDLAEKLIDYASPEHQLLLPQQKTSRNIALLPNSNYLLATRIGYLKFLDSVFEKLHISKSKLSPISEIEYVLILARVVKAKLKILKSFRYKHNAMKV